MNELSTTLTQNYLSIEIEPTTSAKQSQSLPSDSKQTSQLMSTEYNP